jgi:5'-3' exonuclease
MSIVNHLEDKYPIDKVLTFSGSKGNFRKLITPKYKANRKKQELPPLLDEMHQFVKEQYDSIWGYGVETDDMVARYWKQISDDIGRDEVMIVSIDKDYKQFPCLMYNYHYKHKEILDITEEEAMYNFYEQMIVGDTADNVNYFKGKGKKYAEKHFKDCTTKYQYTRKLYELFKQEYKGKAKQKYAECYHLLKLRTQ